jgi:predicted glutamine amidotransferase
VHGCGIGWYGPRPGSGLVDALGLSSYERPAVYTTTSAPSHDRNLRSLAKMVETGLLFGHVRAAGPGASVHEYNTHPFCCGRYLFQVRCASAQRWDAAKLCRVCGCSHARVSIPAQQQHNGDIARFSKIRRKLLARLRDCLFDWMSGTTDSELLFALFLNALPDAVTLQPPHVLAAALKEAMRLVVEACGGEPSSINVACTDGECVLATRFRNGPGETPPSLYYHVGPLPGSSWDLTHPSAAPGVGLGGMTGNLTQDGLLVTHEPAIASAHSVSQLGTSYDGGGGAPGSLVRRSSFERRQPHPRQSLLVASEPLAEDGAADLSEWRVFPPNTLLVASPQWRGGACDGQRAHRCDLQDSTCGEDVEACHCAAEGSVVLLDLRFESLEQLAAWQQPQHAAAAQGAATLASAASAGKLVGVGSDLPPRCPARAASPQQPVPVVVGGAGVAAPAECELDFAALSFD